VCLLVYSNSASGWAVLYAGYTTVSFSNQKGSIAFSALTDVTDSIPKYPSTGGDEPVTGELADATNWDEQKWSSWFDTHPDPAPDSMNALAVSEFAQVNAQWIAANPWWNSLYIAWVTGGTQVPGINNGASGPITASRLRKQWIRN
jgi:hypothetical protein